MNEFVEGLNLVLHLSTFLWCAFGSVLGIILGALPGLTATMGIALVIPISYQLDTATGIGLLLAVYCGAVCGASIPAVLLGIPGNPNAIATVEDGLLMTKKGLAGQALGGVIIASVIGGLGSEIFLIFFSPLVAKMTLAFGPAEKCTLSLVGIIIIAAVSGKSLLKGLLMGAVGFVLAFLGPDPMSGALRIPFTTLLSKTPLASGLDMTSVLIGLYGVSQVFFEIKNIVKNEKKEVCTDIGKVIPPFKKITSMWKIILSSLGIGTLIGAVPGTGASIAVFMSRNAAQGICAKSKGKLDMPGTGCLEGVFAPEVANNAVTGGALIPALSLGIPGDSATAVLIGALLINGVTPGFSLFSQNMPLVYSIFVTLLISNIFMGVFQFAGIRIYPKVLLISQSVLMPIVLILSFVGPYALAGSSVSKGVYFLGTSLVMGIFGYYLKINDYPIAPIVLGLILGKMFEEQFRKGIKLGGGTFERFYTSPICMLFIALVIFVIVSTAIKNRKAKKC
ncbi:tripartite tricarboxylate transporter permease [Amygdalobacter nucleatus]|uniref:Membrane protein n=1 Tax=Amygdalobacter nucleatus TaxID=3029274 RepID=A0A133YHQ7_9FIRM|nr:tripartite tricarboxylate transporter permease [Amygdalobacter nucleatus]KXB42718.1 membrane protein [Amygdalobacter nucleatus]MDF0486218.1 tripartite tricarboxylate transporter permease [Amygdalobacter nucleatus]WEG37225.1 tripartite tricarboxylate transporter permease [Amygdalobacter nucleatus]